MFSAAKPTASPTVFDRDLARHNHAFTQCGAVIEVDGDRYIDPTKAPANLVSSYRLLLACGAANGLLPEPEPAR